MRPVETLDFEGVEVAAGDEDGVGDLVVLGRRAELVVAINELEDVDVDVDVEEGEDEGIGEMMIVEVPDVAVESDVLNVGCDALSDAVVSPEFVSDFFA
jgi:hypothetical protein